MAYWFGWLTHPLTSFDYTGYYFAAKLAFNEHRTPYGFHVFDVFQPAMGRRVNPYLYPPPSLLAFWPIAKLPFVAGHKAFTAVSHLCLLGSTWLMLSKLMPLPSDQRLRQITIGLCLVYIMCSDAVVGTFWLGQLTIIILFFICLALAALRSGASNWRIALPLSIAIVLKAYPVFLLVLLFFRKRFQAIALTCMFIGIVTVISALVLPTDVWSSFLTEVVPAGGYANHQTGSGAVWNQNINAFVTRLLLSNNYRNFPVKYPYLAKPAATILALIVIAITFFYSFRTSRRDHRQESLDDEIAAFLLMIYLVAPLSWDHHMVYLLPVSVLTIGFIISGPVNGRTRAVLAAALFLMAWKLPVEELWLQNGWWSLLISIRFYSVVVLWVFFVNRLRQVHASSFLLNEIPSSANISRAAAANTG